MIPEMLYVFMGVRTNFNIMRFRRLSWVEKISLFLAIRNFRLIAEAISMVYL